MKKRFTDEQIIGFLKQAEAGVPIKDLSHTSVKLCAGICALGQWLPHGQQSIATRFHRVEPEPRQ